MNGQEKLHEAIHKEVAVTSTHPTVLDVGAGMASYHVWLSKLSVLTALDAHASYLNEHRSDLQGVRRIVGLAQVELERLPLNYFDVVMAIDFIEHLEKSQAVDVIKRMQALACSSVLIFTPRGHHPQTQDAFGLGGDHWQTHRSEWQPEDLEALGFKVEVWKDFHTWRPDCDPDALWAVWHRS